MNVVMVGDVVGAGGRRAFCRIVGKMKSTGAADVVVVNGENAANGRGITREIARELFEAGADAITLGDHTWDPSDAAATVGGADPIVRPLNFPPGCPGRGYVVLHTRHGQIAVVSLMGRVFMKGQLDCPFRAIDRLLEQSDVRGSHIVVDMHAEATSEKIVMGRYLDGRVSIVAGTHTHVQTSDERILPRGTAYITDLGMTGPLNSALGREPDSVTSMFLTGMPAAFKVAQGPAGLEGARVVLDNTTGRARSIARIRESVE